MVNEPALFIFAEVAITLAGFSGVVVAFRVRGAQAWSPMELRVLWFLLTDSFLVTFFALIPIPLSLAGWTDDVIWGLGGALLGTYFLVANVLAIRGEYSDRALRRRVTVPVVTPLTYGMSVAAFPMGIALWLSVGNLLVPRGQAIYVLGLIMLLAFGASSFSSSSRSCRSNLVRSPEWAWTPSPLFARHRIRRRRRGQRMILEDSVLVLAGTLTALIAGLFYAFSVAVNGALHRLRDSEYVAAMQSINVVIVRPVFLLTFFGPVLLLPLSAYLQSASSPSRVVLLAVASVLYIAGTIGVTMAGNVPLNNRLARLDMGRSSDGEIAEFRTHFEGPWNRLHSVRTSASIAATILVFIACVVR